MNKILFSVVAIARNEAKTLPRLLASLDNFKAQGGEVVIVDTGSTDNTASIAREWGCIVFEEGARFVKVLDANICARINEKFVVDGEPPIVKEGNRLFDFSAARNYAASKASNPWVLMMDCDEVLTKFEFEKLVPAITNPKVGRLEFEFVYAHDGAGKAIIQFRMSRFYNRLKFEWNKHCVVHEVLTNTCETGVESVYFGEDVIKSEHYQNPSTDRSNYLPGLALDCLLHPENDRNAHYFGRELMYRGRYKSAIRELQRHVDMKRWPAERSQSMVFMGDCHISLGQEDEALHCWHEAFLADGQRREPMMRLAHYFFQRGEHHKTAAYASAALALPRQGLFYGDNENDYRQDPHESLYWALWYIGDREGSGAHWRKAISYQPTNPKYLHDGQFYIQPGLSLAGFTKAVEAHQPFSFVKLGDGERACISGTAGQNCDGQPYSPALARALTGAYASLSGRVHVVDFYDQKTFNMLLHRTDSDLTAVKSFWTTVAERAGVKIFVGPARLKPVSDLLKAQFVEVPLVNAFEAFESIKRQCFEHCKRDALFIFSAGMTSKVLISQMLQLCQDITCIDAGSAFDPMVAETRTFQVSKTVMENLYFGEDKVMDSEPYVTVCIPTLGRGEKLRQLLHAIPATAQYNNFGVLVEHDSFDDRQGVPRLVKKMVEKASGEFIVFLGNDCVPRPGWLRLAMQQMKASFPDMDGLVGFNDCVTDGKENPHWLASKKLLPMLDGEFFHTGYNHVGCDNELTARCKMAGKYAWCEQAEVFHDHRLNIDPDEVYKLAWREDLVAMDRALLESRAEKLGFTI